MCLVSEALKMCVSSTPGRMRRRCARGLFGTFPARETLRATITVTRRWTQPITCGGAKEARYRMKVARRALSINKITISGGCGLEQQLVPEPADRSASLLCRNLERSSLSRLARCFLDVDARTACLGGDPQTLASPVSWQKAAETGQSTGPLVYHGVGPFRRRHHGNSQWSGRTVT